MVDYTDEQLMNMSDEELEAIVNGGGMSAPASPSYTDEELNNMSTEELQKLSGDYNYELPSTGMYDAANSPDQSISEAMQKGIAIRDQYRNTPYSEETVTGLTYKGMRVPPVAPTMGAVASKVGEAYGKTPMGWAMRQIIPDQHLNDKQVDVPWSYIAGTALYDIPFEVSEAAYALTDAVGLTKGATERQQKTMETVAPKLKKEGAGDQFIAEAAQAMPAVLAPLTAMPGARPMVQFLASVGVGAVTRDDEMTEKLAFGENSFLGWEVGKSVAGDETASARVIANRLDLALDDAILGGALEGGVKGTIWATKFAYGLTFGKAIPYISKNSRHMVVMENIARTLRLIENAPNPRSEAAAIRRYSNLVRDNATMFQNIPTEQIDEINRTIVEGLQKKRIKISPMTVLKLDDQLPAEVRAGAEFLHKKANTATAEMPDILRGAADDISEGLGGIPAAESVKDVVDDYVGTTIDATKGQATDALARAETARKDLANLIKGNPEMGKAVEKIGMRSDIFSDSSVAKSMDDVVTQVVDAYQSARTDLGLKRAAVKKFPNKITMGNKSGIETQLTLAKESGSIRPILQRRIDNAGNDAVEWMMEVRPKVSQEIASMKAAGNDTEDLINLKKAIDAGIKELADSSGPRKAALGQAFNDFLDHWQNKYINVWGDGILGDAANILFDAPPLRPVMNEAGERVGQELTHKSTRADIMGSIMKQMGGQKSNEQTALLGKQFVKDMVDAGQSPENITDYIVGKAVSEWRSNQKTGADIAEINVDALADTLRSWSDALEESQPGIGKKLNSFIDSLNAQKGNIENLDEIAKDAVKKADAIEGQLKGDQFSSFYEKGAESLAEDAPQFTLRQSGTKALREVLSDGKNPSEKLKKILAVSDSPDTRRGIQVAWIQEFLDRSFKGVDEASIGNMKGVLNDKNVDAFLKIGEEVFSGKDKVLLDILKSTMKDTVGEQTSLGKMLTSALSPQKFDTDVANAAHVLITWTLGVLNRTAARARSGIGAALRSNPVAQDVLGFYDQVLTDPDLFADSLDELASIIEKRGVRSKEARNVLLKVASKVMNVGDSKDEQLPDYKTTEELLSQIEMDLAMKDNTKKKGSASEETLQMLSPR